jgi:CLIP-associating protein 1/2
LSPASTPPQARSELKKLLLARNVRKTIADGIINRVLGGETVTEVLAGGEDVVEGGTGGRSGLATPAVGDEVEMVYVASGRDLESEFAKMLPSFEVCERLFAYQTTTDKTPYTRVRRQSIIGHQEKSRSCGYGGC